MYAVDAVLMKHIDTYTIEEVGIPSMVLMENASRSVVSNIVKKELSIDKKKSIIVICGNGNNGGDGVCTARILYEMGYNVEIYLVAKLGKKTVELEKQLEIADKCGVPHATKLELVKYDIIVDAIFGVGLSREIKGHYYEIIDKINKSGKKVYSIDAPSGINSSNGRIHGICVNADYTVTFGCIKTGMIMYPGRKYVGKVIVEDIGFPKYVLEKFCHNVVIKDGKLDSESILTSGYGANIYTEEDYKKSIPSREAYSNKGTYGNVLVIAGSKNMSGASYLSAKAAYKMGAGLVKVFTSSENRQIIQTMLPEAILSTYDEEPDRDNVLLNSIENGLINKLKNDIEWADVIVIGPGIGTGEMAVKIVEHTLYNANVPCIVDADALNIIAQNKGLFTKALNNVICTPHLKELSRIMDKDIEYIKEYLHKPLYLYTKLDLLDKQDYNNVLVMKDAVTMTVNGEKSYVNTSGNNGLATAGSGDVLTGIIAGLVAGGCSNIEAASLGVYIHGLCADRYVNDYNEYSLNASDIIDYIEKVL